MRIDRLSAVNVRNLADVTLEPAPRLNLIYGANGAGKTALLESVYLLARGRSFRSHRIDEVVSRGADTLQVSANLDHQADGKVVTGLERAPGRLRIRYAGENVSTVSAHARKFPVVLLTPDTQELVLGAPKARRNWLDWSMFHVEPGYLEHWREYYRALRQRNALLKHRAPPDQLAGWEEAMSEPASRMDAARRWFVGDLEERFTDLATGFWEPAPEIGLLSGWDTARPLQECLAQSRADDRQVGHTRHGPHRADVRFRHGGVGLEAEFSRGNSKLFVSLLILAQARVIASAGERPVLLLDDAGAELDSERENRLLDTLLAEPAQIFLTRTEKPENWVPRQGDAMFHVERGRFTKMVE